MSEAIVAIGVDAGSTTCKVVGIDAQGHMVDWRLSPTKPKVDQQVSQMVSELTQNQKLPTVATGYGRKLISNCLWQITEITCHARGVFQNLHQAGTLVDIGGQDSKVIVIGPKGKAVDFIMNDKCAAGTGRFLEHTASRLEVAIEHLGPRALEADHSEHISSTCTVFAESEIISLIANGVEVDVILAGLHHSLVSRISGMINNVGFRAPLMLSGGVSQNIAIQKYLGETFDTQVVLPDQPQLMGAYGAALIASERVEHSYIPAHD